MRKSLMQETNLECSANYSSCCKFYHANMGGYSVCQHWQHGTFIHRERIPHVVDSFQYDCVDIHRSVVFSMSRINLLGHAVASKLLRELLHER